MESQDKFVIPLVRGRTDLLRIPQQTVTDLEIVSPITVRIKLPDEHVLPVRINPIDRTLTGLGPWFSNCKDSDERTALCFTVLSKEPLSLSVDYTDDIPPLTASSPHIERPKDGMYLGGKLKSEFFELLQTDEALALDENDLVRHVFICGAIGSGKTVLAKVLIEEAAQKGIPVIAIDLKGDISSMALVASGEDPEEFVPWVSVRRNETIEVKATQAAERHKSNLRAWGLSKEDIHKLKNNIAVNVFTPRSNSGFRLALSAFVEPPQNVEDLRENDPDAYEDVIHFMAETFVSRLGLNKTMSDKAKGYVYEIIRLFWDKDISLRGYDGIVRVLQEIQAGHNNIEQIGGMPTDEYIDQRDRKRIADAINALLIGAQKLWFQGIPLNVEELINPENFDGKTPVSIINIKHLAFSDQAYVVGYLAYLIWFWMRPQKGSEEPRLIFYIDEIGGGGSKEAFFHSVVKSPAKPALNLLVRQGRAFGVCCVFATQSPGDIDYRAMGQCATWAVGQLRTKRERQKIEEGAGIADLDFDKASQHLSNLNPGQFLIKTPSESWHLFQERWLMHLHRVLSDEDIKKLKMAYERDASSIYEQAQAYSAEKKLAKAKSLLVALIEKYRFSSIYARTHLFLGTVLFEMLEYVEAIQILEGLIQRRMDAEEIGDAYFLLGKCHEQLGQFDDARSLFSRVKESGAKDDTKNQAFNHQEYCRARSQWIELSDVKKFVWWILGKAPDQNAMVRLQAVDKDLIEERIIGVLDKKDFDLPEKFDLGRLLEAQKVAQQKQDESSAEKAISEKWIQEQLPKAEVYLKNGEVEEAAFLAQKIFHRITDNNLAPSNSVIKLLRQCNEYSQRKEHELNRKILSLQARKFEFEIANLFRRKGYLVLVTSMTGDDGVDVFASSAIEKIIIQCKRWKKPVGRATVDELAGVHSRYRTDRAILATTSSFSEDAQNAARETNIELWDFVRLTQEWKQIYIAK
jgi:HJR/Mrr/RecB family endonuclease/TolA-binding protein